MSAGPRVLRDLGDGWTLRQWEYDGAPLIAVRRGRWTEVEVYAEPTGLEIEIDGLNRYEIPAAVVRALLGLEPPPHPVTCTGCGGAYEAGHRCKGAA